MIAVRVLEIMNGIRASKEHACDDVTVATRLVRAVVLEVSVSMPMCKTN